jgi:hypothetical protein
MTKITLKMEQLSKEGFQPSCRPCILTQYYVDKVIYVLFWSQSCTEVITFLSCKYRKHAAPETSMYTLFPQDFTSQLAATCKNVDKES